ncbi:MAG: carbohydrate kinase family protein [Candidatus Dependentiae bacterium]
MKKVLTFGGAMYDIFIEYEQTQSIQLHLASGSSSFLVLPEGKKIELNKLSYHIGGGAANSAVSFARQGHYASCLVKVGNDQAGQFLKNNLANNKVNTQFIITSSQSETGTSFIIPCSSGDRTILIYRGANRIIQANEISLELLNDIDQIYITSLAGQSAEHVPYFLQEAKKKKIKTAINPGTTQLTTALSTLVNSLSFLDILILNAHEAQLLLQSLTKQSEKKIKFPKLLYEQAPCFTLKEFISRIKDFGITTLVVTNGAEGVYVAHDQTLFFHPSLKITPVSTVGAGDAFGSTFVGSLLHDHSIENAIRRGLCNSAAVLSHVGATTGLLTSEKLQECGANIDPNLLQTFTI